MKHLFQVNLCKITDSEWHWHSITSSKKYPYLISPSLPPAPRGNVAKKTTAEVGVLQTTFLFRAKKPRAGRNEWLASWVIGDEISKGWNLGVSKNSGFSPQIIHFNKVFHYKPSNFGVFPYFWKHPNELSRGPRDLGSFWHHCLGGDFTWSNFLNLYATVCHFCQCPGNPGMAIFLAVQVRSCEKKHMEHMKHSHPEDVSK